MTLSFVAFLAAAFAAVAQENDTKESKPDEPAVAVQGELPFSLNFGGRFTQAYTVVFSARLDEKRFQIIREKTANYSRAVFVVKLGEKSEDGKFRLDKHIEKVARNELGITIDASEIHLTWLETGKQYVITRRVPETIPTFFANLKGDQFSEYVKEGDTFSYPSHPSLKIKLVKVEEEVAHVEFKDEKDWLRKTEIRAAPEK